MAYSFSHNPPAIGHAAMCQCGHAALLHEHLHSCRVARCQCRRFHRPANTLADRVNLESLGVLMAFKKRFQPKQPVINIYGVLTTAKLDKRIEDTSWIR